MSINYKQLLSLVAELFQEKNIGKEHLLSKQFLVLKHHMPLFYDLIIMRNGKKHERGDMLASLGLAIEKSICNEDSPKIIGLSYTAMHLRNVLLALNDPGSYVQFHSYPKTKILKENR